MKNLDHLGNPERSNTKLNFRRIPFYHLELNNLDSYTALELIDNHLSLEPENLLSISFVNAHCFNLSLDDLDYLIALKESSLVLNDGIGIKLAAKKIGVSLPENMNGTDLIPKLIELCSIKGKSVFFLGGGPSIAEKASKYFLKLFPSLVVAGVHSGFFDNCDEIIETINSSKADILIVGMGVPKQEKWVFANSKKLKSISLSVSGGAILDFAAGKFPRAPEIMRKTGTEWIFRLLLEPKRLHKRYIYGNIKFLLHIFAK